MGEKGGVPVIFLHHLTAVLEDWDPRVVDGLAANHHVIIFDNRGVGASGGSTPNSVEEMAADAVAFIVALGFAKVDLFGFSLGGFVAQVIAQQWPGLVRKIILAGTGPAGGENIGDVARFCRTHLPRQRPTANLLNTSCSFHNRQMAKPRLTISTSASRNGRRTEIRPSLTKQFRPKLSRSIPGARAMPRRFLQLNIPSWSLMATAILWCPRSIHSNWPAGCRMHN
jgi:pimeloyl-ACP methyl ester carboxylesterase